MKYIQTPYFVLFCVIWWCSLWWKSCSDKKGSCFQAQYNVNISLCVLSIVQIVLEMHQWDWS